MKNQAADVPASEDHFIWGSEESGLRAELLETTESYTKKHSCVDKIATFFVGTNPMLYSKLKASILNKLRNDCYQMLEDMPTSHIYDTLPGGRSEFIHQAIKGNYISESSVELINMLIKECVTNYVMENDQVFSHEIDLIDNRRVFEVHSISVNLTTQHDYHRTHDHSCDLSGAVYLDVDSEAINKKTCPQGCIEWFSTAPVFLQSSCPIAYLSFMPESGDGCLWKGTVPHHVYPTFKPNKRLMITYNANFITNERTHNNTQAAAI
jgi:hypothetical protein